MERKTTEFEQGWDYIQTGITKLQRYLEGLPEPAPDSQQYIRLYTTAYNMCQLKRPHDYSQQLYDKYREAVEEYVNSTVLPALMEKDDDEYMLLQELVKRWSNQKKMVTYLSMIFRILDRYFVKQRSLPPLKEVGLTCFRDLVYNKLNRKLRKSAITLIDKEREGEDIDREVVKKAVDFYTKIGIGTMESYEEYFERFLLEDTSSYYSCKASKWIEEDSYNDYILKSEECLKKEKERVTHYLHSSSVPKLIKKVEHELLVKYANQLLQQSEFREMARSLEHIANIFKKYVTDADGHEDTEEHVLIRKLIELQDKYTVSVTKYSQNHTLFYKTLEEEFESFRRQTVDGSSSKC